MNKTLSYDLLNINPEIESKRLEEFVKVSVNKKLKKKGVIIGLSGGIDSSLCGAICTKALGKDNVIGIFSPEKESEDETNVLGKEIADHLDIKVIHEDITEVLSSLKCYERRNEAIRRIIPGFKDSWGIKIIQPNPITSNMLNVPIIVVRDDDNNEIKKRVDLKSYLQIVSASNFKQRVRKIIEYYHAERLNYSVVGTPNFLEYDLGFFVKYGDGAADIKPISHLYKSQVFQLGKYYKIPEKILNRIPTTDTYSLPQTQEEFYFSLPLQKMDISLYAYNNSYSFKELSTFLSIPEQIARKIFNDIKNKKNISNLLLTQPLVLN